MLTFRRVFQRLANSKTFRNSNWLVLGGVSIAAISFLTSAIVARHLSVDDYGLLQLCLTLFVFVQFGENLVFPTVFKKDLLENPAKTKFLYLSGIQIIFLFAVICVLSFVALYFLTSNWFFLLMATASIGLLFRIANVISFHLDISLKSRTTQIFQLSGLVVGSIAKVVFAISGLSVFWQVVAVPITYLVSSALHFRSDALARSALSDLFDFDWAAIRSLTKKGVGFLTVGACGLVLYRIDVILLGWLADAREVGIYSVAVKLSEPWLFIGSAISTSFFPFMIRQRKIGKIRYYSGYAKLFWLLLLISLSISSFIFLFSDLIVSMTFGSKYMESASVLRVHSWTIVFLFLYSLHHIWDVNEGLAKFALLRSISAAALNILLNFILIPKYGAIACAWSSLFAYFFYGYGFNLFHRKGRFLLLQEIKRLPAVVKSLRILKSSEA